VNPLCRLLFLPHSHLFVEMGFYHCYNPNPYSMRYGGLLSHPALSI
jgi:hypothetical protein